MIPIFLTVYGAMVLASVPIVAVPWCLYQCSDEDDNPLASGSFCLIGCLACLVPLFISIWFICGNVWVFSIYQPSYEMTSGTYCDDVTYKFSVAVIIITWVSPFLSSCFSFCCSLQSSSHEN